MQRGPRKQYQNASNELASPSLRYFFKTLSHVHDDVRQQTLIPTVLLLKQTKRTTRPSGLEIFAGSKAILGQKHAGTSAGKRKLQSTKLFTYREALGPGA